MKYSHQGQIQPVAHLSMVLKLGIVLKDCTLNGYISIFMTISILPLCLQILKYLRSGLSRKSVLSPALPHKAAFVERKIAGKCLFFFPVDFFMYLSRTWGYTLSEYPDVIHVESCLVMMPQQGSSLLRRFESDIFSQDLRVIKDSRAGRSFLSLHLINYALSAE